MTAIATASTSEACRILLVDPDAAGAELRDALAAEPWVETVEEARGAAHAEAAAARLRPDVAVVASPPGVAEDATCQRVKRGWRPTRILFVGTTPGDSPGAARAAGAAGAVPGDWAPGDLAGAVRMVALGMTVFPAGAADEGDVLSEREHAVLRLMAGGATNPEIADRLYLSPHTVKDHTTALYRKLNARNRAEAVARAQRRGLLD